MPRFVRDGSLALSLLVFAACGDAGGPGPEPLTVAEARALWESKHLTTYSYFGSQTSFSGTSGMVRVDVSDGRVLAVTDMTTHAQISTVGWLTVDQLLNLAETLQPRPVEFDRDFGFPKRVERCCVVDDSGSVYTISSLFVIPLSI